MTPALTRRLYVMAWLVLGTIALGYFFFLFQSLRTSDGARISAWPLSGSSTSGELPADTDPALSRALARMHSEIGRLKSDLNAMDKENAALKAHIATLEAAFGPVTSALTPQSQKNLSNAINDSEILRSKESQKVDITMLPMPADGFADALPEAPLPIASQPAPERTRFAVEVASAVKPDELETHWSGLKERHPELLGQLQPRRVPASWPAAGFNLVAGPFDNAAAAARLCAKLTAAGTKCTSAVFTGTPLNGIAAR